MKHVHELKIWPEFYFRVLNGTKTFEYRDNDRNFQAGDKVILKEWDPTPINPDFNAPVGFTGSPALEFQIGYVLPVERDKVVFSLLPITKIQAPPPGPGGAGGPMPGPLTSFAKTKKKPSGA